MSRIYRIQSDDDDGKKEWTLTDTIPVALAIKIRPSRVKAESTLGSALRLSSRLSSSELKLADGSSFLPFLVALKLVVGQIGPSARTIASEHFMQLGQRDGLLFSSASLVKARCMKCLHSRACSQIWPKCGRRNRKGGEATGRVLGTCAARTYSGGKVGSLTSKTGGRALRNCCRRQQE